MKKLLIFIDWFTPGYRAGGPIKSIQNLVYLLNDSYEIYIYTSDRDLGMQKPYEGLAFNTWVNVDTNISVYYAKIEEQHRDTIREIIREVEPQFVYCNSMFSWHFSIQVLMQRKLFPQVRFILAPRGMLKSSALKYKSLKKRIFLTLAKTLGIYDNVYFHATDNTEVNDIKNNLAKSAELIEEIGNCPAKPDFDINKTVKEVGKLHAYFVGRIHPIKNLDYLLRLLSKVNSQVTLTVIGPHENKDYLADCQSIISLLPSNIKVNIVGEQSPFELENLAKQQHLLILPTTGENFGHAIYEALGLGKPVLISDQTPWNNVEEYNAGYALPLSNTEEFVQKIEYFASLNQLDYNIHCYGAIQLANLFYENPEIKEKYQNLFSIH